MEEICNQTNCTTALFYWKIALNLGDISVLDWLGVCRNFSSTLQKGHCMKVDNFVLYLKFGEEFCSIF